MIKPQIMTELKDLPANVNMKEKIEEETHLRWRALSDDDKRQFVNRSVRDYKRYEDQMKLYNNVQRERKHRLS